MVTKMAVFVLAALCAAKSRDLLTELDELMKVGKDVMFRESSEMYLCLDRKDVKECSDRILRKYRKDIKDCLNNNLIWKERAVNLLQSLEQCMAA